MTRRNKFLKWQVTKEVREPEEMKEVREPGVEEVIEAVSEVEEVVEELIIREQQSSVSNVTN